MAIDIHGWIEVKRFDWCGAVNLSLVGDRDYWVFDCLFGTSRVSPRYRPIAARRGMPADPSREVMADLADYDPSFTETVTWLTWAEIADFDWSRAIDWPTIDIEIYSKTPHGLLFRGTKSHASLLSRDDDNDLLRLGSLERRGHFYKIRPRAAPLEASDHWKQLFAVCRNVADTFGPLSVRFVVWFE